MNENLTLRVVEYLLLDTNYAVIINGDYGIGKTYYIKNILFPEVEKVVIPSKENSENYIPIHVSLFGIKSIEDVQRQIFIGLYPILKSKGLGLASDIGKSLLKFATGKDIEDLFSASGSLIDYNKILLCIDDIDRKSEDLELKELYGFINSLVENTNAKIIVVANEDELRKGFEGPITEYSIIREKVIGVSINFISDVQSVFREIIKNKYYEKHKEYYNFLNKNQEKIIIQIKKNKDNLRNLIFFLEHFKVIFQALLESLDSENKLQNFKEDIQEITLAFTLPIAIEYKLGKLNSSNFDSIKKIHKGRFFDLASVIDTSPISRFGKKEDSEKKEKTYEDEYKSKYLDSNQPRRYFDSIFNYIIGNSSFDVNQLLSEFESLYNLEDNKIPEREKVLQKLSYWQCIDLEFPEYRELTNKLLEFVDKGEFDLEKYASIFHYASRFNNLLRFNMNKLVNRFKRGIKKGSDKYSYQPSLSFHLAMSGKEEFYEETKQIIGYCVKINDEIKEKNDSLEIVELFNSFKSNLNEFIEKFESDQNVFRHTPFYHKWNFYNFWQAFKKHKNSELIIFGFHFDHRYRKMIASDLIEEKGFLVLFKKKLETEITRPKVKSVDKVCFKILLKKVDSALLNFD